MYLKSLVERLTLAGRHSVNGEDSHCQSPCRILYWPIPHGSRGSVMYCTEYVTSDLFQSRAGEQRLWKQNWLLVDPTGERAFSLNVR